ncbi:relaxase/mobilization nuclease domain-containing protein [Taibaiella koreensis]|uniref:relaxase/mobilization nuclease domain-containing protein n=1 Tax=Taibaiella koreensis TaxID=1268548 RepID=UPI000E59C8A8|nr:relaxase/mobilization nuclease domain-containing protein [Taibaiella koreensis]
MIAVIKPGRSLRKSFFYNENKVSEGAAVLLDAVNYPLNTDELSEFLRLNMLERTSQLHPDVKVPGIHISLNFSQEERLSEDQLRQISGEYMEAIGFGDQPYLLYQHFDAGHPHVHIVTLRVRPDGTNIDTFNIGKRLSVPAVQALEQKYDLVRWADHKKEFFKLNPIDATAVKYGKTGTKRAIGNVLSKVLEQYKYCSLQELNAVLNLYNVHADGGQEESRLHNFRGLIYKVIGPDGKGISVPIKASAFAYKAKLADIEKRFLRSDVERQRSKPALRLAIDKAIRQPGVTDFTALKEELKKAGVDLVLRQNKDGYIYGLTYVDHRNKVVFNGSDLGNYSAKAIAERLAETFIREKPQAVLAIAERQSTNKNADAGRIYTNVNGPYPFSTAPGDQQKSIIEMLLQPEYTSNYLPYELRRTRRKKRKRINK